MTSVTEERYEIPSITLPSENDHIGTARQRVDELRLDLGGPFPPLNRWHRVQGSLIGRDHAIGMYEAMLSGKDEPSISYSFQHIAAVRRIAETYRDPSLQLGSPAWTSRMKRAQYAWKVSGVTAISD